jgi:hypothetical protein
MATLGRRQAFIYWHVDSGAQADAVAAVLAQHARWATEWPALVAQGFVRSDAASAPTVMETYALSTGNGLTAADLDRIARAAELATARWRIGGRHVECFDRCD